MIKISSIHTTSLVLQRYRKLLNRVVKKKIFDVMEKVTSNGAMRKKIVLLL